MSGVSLEPLTLFLLFLVAFVAGLIDAIAGGGGLLTVPALLQAGVPPALVLGSNKGAAIFGSAAALARFSRAGLVDVRRAPLLALCGVLGAVLGSHLILRVDPAALRAFILLLLVAAGALVAFLRPPSRPPAAAPLRAPRAKAAIIALSIGTYDGFFGPGTGTFLIVALCFVLEQRLTEASANAKVVNFASNVGALTVFALRGAVLWDVALPMALGQLLGGALGSHLAVRCGDRLVRRVVLLVVLLLVARLASDLGG